MTGPSVDERIKDDLGYLRLARARECFATLVDEARERGWDHLEFLARLVGEEAAATRNLNRPGIGRDSGYWIYAASPASRC